MNISIKTITILSHVATVIFITGGMNIAWSVGFRSRGYYRLTEHTRVAWFIGAIIGTAIASFLPKILPKRVITVSWKLALSFSLSLNKNDLIILLLASFLSYLARFWCLSAEL